RVLRNEQGEVDVIDVVGQDKDYDKPDGRRIRDEIVPVLRKRKINPERSVLLLFCNLMDYDPVAGTISHHSPYYGGGSHLAGTAWQCDSAILDPLRFRDPTPILDGEYGRITVGRHNSIFIGGVIHELGHALSLPHCRQRPDESKLGTALMGSGNRTYAQELRNEGRGTFLTLAHAFRLAALPVFNPTSPPSMSRRPDVEFEALKVFAGEDRLIQIQGRVVSDIPIHAMIAYFDPDGGGDYDALTISSVPDAAGEFAMQSSVLAPNTTGELRLVACHVNGATSSQGMRYQIDESGKPVLKTIRLKLELKSMIAALRAGNLQAAKQQLAALAEDDSELKQIGQQVLDRFGDPVRSGTIDPTSVPVQTRKLFLSDCEPSSAKVGWLRPVYDQVPNGERLLSVGGDYFARGIFAHAPARHVYELNGEWKRISGLCGVQGSNFGRVDFTLLGDGRTLWSARRVSAGEGKRFDVAIDGVETLTLIVGDSGNGRNGDWGVWIEPLLTR
ncbi:MAG: NPCBM/NEW2 domain-containing protein, partial [Rubripirellula sp.]|nr:NPCBM/NEW2 domain-containing protein [Rubripirellula sp.]